MENFVDVSDLVESGIPQPEKELMDTLLSNKDFNDAQMVALSIISGEIPEGATPDEGFKLIALLCDKIADEVNSTKAEVAKALAFFATWAEANKGLFFGI